MSTDSAFIASWKCISSPAVPSAAPFHHRPVRFENLLCKHLIEKEMHQHVHFSVALADPLEHSASPSVRASPTRAAPAPPAVLAALTKPHRAHKKHNPGHKSGSLRGTTSKHSIASLCCARLGEKSCSDLGSSRWSTRASITKTNWCRLQPLPSPPAPSTPLGLSGLSRPGPCMPGQLSPLTPTAKLLLPCADSSSHHRSPRIVQPSLPMDELLLLCQCPAPLTFAPWVPQAGTLSQDCFAPLTPPGLMVSPFPDQPSDSEWSS